MKKLRKILLLHELGSNLILLAFFSIVITFLSTRLPEKLCFYKKWLYKERKWERGGRIYQDMFKVKKWKSRVPELSDFIKSIYPKKYINEYSIDYLLTYLTESCKAELTHVAIILASLLFHAWNSFFTATVIFIIAFILNIPFIIIQRYNRPRIVGMLKYKGFEA